jgi:hypothetical protein
MRDVSSLQKPATLARKCRESPARIGNIPVFGRLSAETFSICTGRHDRRWLLDRDDSPWYPTARLFRQTDTRDWHSVVDRVRTALNDFGRK